MRYAVLFLWLLLFTEASAHETRVKLTGAPVQGGLVKGMATPGAAVALDGRALRVGPGGVFVIGFGRDAGRKATLTVSYADGTVETKTLAVRQRKYRIQRIDGLPPGKVTPGPEQLKQIRSESALIRRARKLDSGGTGFSRGFIWPSWGRISGIYGSQRILNGKPRAPHAGVDVAAKTGTPVVAAADGVVSLARTGMFFTGGTVMIDHGFGVGTIYAHMSAVDVKTGQKIKRGARIGAIGATGRVTGPHLHWGLSWFDTRLDPALITGPMGKSR